LQIALVQALVGPPRLVMGELNLMGGVHAGSPGGHNRRIDLPSKRQAANVRFACRKVVL
jgi:hypothetical protein